MIEARQLKYFVVVSDVGSFSEAAKVLYTTQSGVSKVIISLEKEMGCTLFKREKRGVLLTADGERFIKKARELVILFESLERESRKPKRDTVRIGISHSSFISNCFSDFYEKYKEEDTCFFVHADSADALLNRISLMMDEICFVFVFPDTKKQFEYDIKRYGLKFECIKSLDGMIYFHPEDVPAEKRKRQGTLHHLKFIQSEEDDFLRSGKWELESGEPLDIRNDISVITNSDYVMHAMLERNHLANFSAYSFNSFKEGYGPGVRIRNKNGSIGFCAVTNEKLPPGDKAMAFLDYIKGRV